jgi:hypothetical protein
MIWKKATGRKCKSTVIAELDRERDREKPILGNRLRRRAADGPDGG